MHQITIPTWLTVKSLASSDFRCPLPYITSDNKMSFVQPSTSFIHTYVIISNAKALFHLLMKLHEHDEMKILSTPVAPVYRSLVRTMYMEYVWVWRNIKAKCYIVQFNEFIDLFSPYKPSKPDYSFWIEIHFRCEMNGLWQPIQSHCCWPENRLPLLLRPSISIIGRTKCILCLKHRWDESVVGGIGINEGVGEKWQFYMNSILLWR